MVYAFYQFQVITMQEWKFGLLSGKCCPFWPKPQSLSITGVCRHKNSTNTLVDCILSVSSFHNLMSRIYLHMLEFALLPILYTLFLLLVQFRICMAPSSRAKNNRLQLSHLQHSYWSYPSSWEKFVFNGMMSWEGSFAMSLHSLEAAWVNCNAASGCAVPGNMVHSRSNIEAIASSSSWKPKDKAAFLTLFNSL